MKLINFFLGFIFLLVSCKETIKEEKTILKPNIIYILADDLGYGDLSCYGQTKFNTPNIDELAEDGMLFTQHYSGATVCAPSRSALLTGKHTGHTYIRGNKEVRPEGQTPLPKSTKTFSKMLQEQGYTTGAFGKWGLGYPSSEGDPLNQGFDRFYGYNCQRLGHHYYPYHLWDNDKKVILEGNAELQKNEYAPDLVHEEALNFIEKHKEEPFFLYYPSIVPHAELVAPKKYMQQHIGKYEPEKKYKGLDNGKGYRQGQYESQEFTHAAFAAMIHLLDDQVGEIVDKIKELGLEDNTIIIFTSDNGPHKEGGADPDYFNSNGIYRGYKRDLYEGGIRVPMIVKWKGKIKEGTTTNYISAFWDVFPTISEITSAKEQINVDGISFLPTLLGKEQTQQHKFLYWEFHELEGRIAVRQNNWKLVQYQVKNNGEYELYNLQDDPSEEYNLANKFPKKVKELLEIAENSRTESEIFKF